MALWRDPLDELIEDLEKALPPAPTPSDAQGLLGMSLVELKLMVRETHYGQRNEALIIEAEAIAADNDLDTPGNDAEKKMMTMPSTYSTVRAEARTYSRPEVRISFESDCRQ